VFQNNKKKGWCGKRGIKGHKEEAQYAASWGPKKRRRCREGEPKEESAMRRGKKFTRADLQGRGSKGKGYSLGKCLKTPSFTANPGGRKSGFAYKMGNLKVSPKGKRQKKLFIAEKKRKKSAKRGSLASEMAIKMPRHMPLPEPRQTMQKQKDLLFFGEVLSLEDLWVKGGAELTRKNTHAVHRQSAKKKEGGPSRSIQVALVR